MGNQVSKGNVVRRMLDMGCTYAYIEENLHVSSKTIAAIRSGKHATRGRGRPPIVTGEILSYIEVNSLANALLTDRQMADLLEEKFGIRVSRSQGRGRG